MVANMKLVFTNVPSRHNSAQVIQKRLKFKRVVITFKLAYVSSLGTWPALATQPHYEAPCELWVKHRQNKVTNIERVRLLPQ